MDAAFQSAGGWEKDHTHPDRGRREKFYLLECHGESDGGRGAVFLENGKVRLAEGRSGRREVFEPRQGDARARQGGVRQLLRALSFEQGSESAGECRRGRLESILGMDEDRRL